MHEHGTAPAQYPGGRPRGPRVTIICPICSKTREVKPSEAARGAKFCSDACARVDKTPTETSIRDRVWSKIQKTDTSWLWTGAKNSMGYGQFMLTKNPPVYKLAAHYMWWEKTGHWPVRGEVILHTCDTTCGTPLCVRNDDEGTYEIRGRTIPRHGHLALDTHQGNMDDMVAKGRKATKIDSAQATEIRRLHDAGASLTDLAKANGMTVQNVSHIIHRRSWKHVP